MNGLVITPAFRDVLEDDSILSGLKEFSFDFEELLDRVFDLDDPVGTLPFGPDRLTFEIDDAFGPGGFTLSILGSGFGPLSSAQDFEDALMQGTATGTITQILATYDDGDAFQNTEILSIEVAPTGYSLTSGGQRVEITGDLPDTLDQLGDLTQLAMALEEAPGSIGDLLGEVLQYGITGVTLFDGGQEVLDLAIDFEGGSIVARSEGYTLDITFDELPLQELAEALAGAGLGGLPFGELPVDVPMPEPELLQPHLRLYNAAGALVAEEAFDPEEFDFGFGFFDLFVEFQYTSLPGGTYYLAAGAVEDASTGFYTIGYDGFGFGDFDILREDEDAPADTSTPYFLPEGWEFDGAIMPMGDRDWVEIALDAGSNYFFYMETRPFDLFELLDGIVIGPITMTDPDGEVIFEIPPIDLGDPERVNEVIMEIERLLDDIGIPDLPFDFAWAAGDPHLLTLDGAAYDFHAAGEFVMVRDSMTGGSQFELQARMAPVGENVTANIAAAMRLDGGNVMIDSTADQPFSIDGTATEIEQGRFVEVGSDRVYREGNTFTLLHTGDGMMETGYSAVVVSVFHDRVDIAVGLDQWAWAGQVEGLLGNFNGNAADDIAFADGTPLDRPLAFDDLYGQFRDDWRVSDEADSLFTYGPGESLDGFYLPNYPTAMISLDDFDADAIAAAQAAVEAGGLTPGTLFFDNAVLDLLLTGDESYIESAAGAAETTAPVMDTSGTQTDGGGLQGLLSLGATVSDAAGAELAGTRVTFRPEGKSLELVRNSGADGKVVFDMPDGEAGRLDAVRQIQAGDPAVTTSDALEVLRLAVGLNPGWGAPASAENFIAADVNGDGRVTTSDALEVLRAAVGLETEFGPRWVFVDSTDDLAGVTGAGQVDYATGVDVALIGAGMDVGLTGILLGNIEQV